MVEEVQTENEILRQRIEQLKRRREMQLAWYSDHDEMMRHEEDRLHTRVEDNLFIYLLHTYSFSTSSSRAINENKHMSEALNLIYCGASVLLEPGSGWLVGWRFYPHK